MKETKQAMIDPVGNLFVNREQEFEMYAEWIRHIPDMPSNSYALVGRRRTGKTAVLVRLYNHLFFKQERVMPVYISFAEYLNPKKPLTMIDVAEHFLSSYLLCYLAFQYRRPDLMQEKPRIDFIRTLAAELNDVVVIERLKMFDTALAEQTTSTSPVKVAINAPKTIAGLYNQFTAVIVDEFQVLTNVYDEKRNIWYDLTDSFQQCVDSRVAPMLVSGSAVSLLINQALRGLLTGRFNYWYLAPLSRDHTHDLAFRLAALVGVEMNAEFAEMLWQVTAGYPNNVENLMRSRSPARRRYPCLDALKEVLVYEVSNRLANTWQLYSAEFNEHIGLLNGDGLAKKVMLWVTKYPDPPIDAEQIAQAFDVTYDEAQAALLKLYQADIIDLVGWERYEGPGDPMLRRYIDYNFRWQLEKISEEQAVESLNDGYNKIRGDLNNALGEIGELYVGMVMRGFDDRSIDGTTYFNFPHAILLPKFESIEKRSGTVVAGDKVEIDVIGQWTQGDPIHNTTQRCAWLVEAKNWSEPIPLPEVEHFLKQAGQMQAKEKYDQVTLWFFSKSGFTKPAINALEKAGVLYSDWKAFFALARQFDLFGLPNRG
ncbi:MAG: ATP-binding protein [Chloroflexota bacterium]